MLTSAPRLDKSYTLNFVGDWGQANFHKVCSWLCQEFCSRAGPKSRAAIWSIRAGGIEAIDQVQDGEADLCIVTPAMLIPHALDGRGIFKSRPAPDVRALAVLPQNDSMILAVDAKLGLTSFEQLRQRRPALRIAASADDGTNFIGHVGRLFMQAHGIDEASLRSWGGCYVEDTHPRDSLQRMKDGTVDAVLQEAVMSPWWADVVESGAVVPLNAEEAALERLKAEFGFGKNVLPAGYWNAVAAPVQSLDFSDFIILVRDDMPEEVAHLLTWCIVETRATLERQYRHLAPNRSPLSYPLTPRKMADSPVPLHPGARRYFEETECLASP